jgi:hypothetical protein
VKALTRKNSNKNNIKYLLFGMAIGGVIGVAFNKGGIGIAIGISFGALIDMIVRKSNK